jgi:hypothetical protein
LNERYGVPQGYVSASNGEGGLTPELVEQGVRMLFSETHDVERWDVRSRHGDMTVEHWEYLGVPDAHEPDQDSESQGSTPELRPIGERLVMLAVRRGDNVAQPMHGDYSHKSGDILSVAIHDLDTEEAHAILIERGWQRYQAPELDEPGTDKA